MSGLNDRLQGAAQGAKGNVEEAAGKVSGNRGLEAQGKLDRARGEADWNRADTGQVHIDKSYEHLRPTFRQHFDTQARTRAVGTTGPTTTTRTWETAEPNYRYGFEAGVDPRYRGRRFEEVEPDLRRTWETTRTTTTRTTSMADDPRWEMLREEVREGFDRARA